MDGRPHLEDVDAHQVSGKAQPHLESDRKPLQTLQWFPLVPTNRNSYDAGMTNNSLAEPVSLPSLLKSFEQGDDSKLIRALRKMDDVSLDHALESAERLHKFSWWLLANVVAERVRRIKPEPGGRGKKAAPGKGRGTEVKRLAGVTGYSERWLWELYRVVEYFGKPVQPDRAVKTWKVSKIDDKDGRADELRMLQVKDKIFRPLPSLSCDHYFAALRLKKFPGAPEDLLRSAVARIEAGIKVTPEQLYLQAERIKRGRAVKDFVAYREQSGEHYEFTTPHATSDKITQIALKLNCASMTDAIVEAIDIAFDALGLENDKESLALKAGEMILTPRTLKAKEPMGGLFNQHTFLDYRQRVAQKKKKQSQGKK